jgi:hypothetical protein
MEIWTDVKGFEDSYEISNFGNLRTKERFVKHYKGGLRKYKPKEKNIRLNENGYFRCNLKKDGKRYDFTIHRLVANSFLENKDDKKAINHINGIKTDNRVENLEWVTLSENTIHAVKNRLIKTKLTDKEVLEISKNKLSTRKIAEIYKVSPSIVWRIKNKKAYKHLWLQYY